MSQIKYSGQSVFELNTLLKDNVVVWLDVNESAIRPFIIKIVKTNDCKEPYKAFVQDVERYSSAYRCRVVEWFVNFCSVHYPEKVRMVEGVK